MSNDAITIGRAVCNDCGTFFVRTEEQPNCPACYPPPVMPIVTTVGETTTVVLFDRTRRLKRIAMPDALHTEILANLDGDEASRWNGEGYHYPLTSRTTSRLRDAGRNDLADRLGDIVLGAKRIAV